MGLTCWPVCMLCVPWSAVIDIEATIHVRIGFTSWRATETSGVAIHLHINVQGYNYGMAIQRLPTSVPSERMPDVSLFPGTLKALPDVIPRLHPFALKFTVPGDQSPCFRLSSVVRSPLLNWIPCAARSEGGG